MKKPDSQRPPAAPGAEVHSLTQARREKRAADADPLTVAGLAAIYEAAGYFNDLKPKSRESYRTALACFGAMRVAEGVWRQDGGLPRGPAAEDVDLYKRRLRDVDGLAAGTVNGYAGSVRAIARHAGAAAGDLTVYMAMLASRELPTVERTPRAPPPDALVRLSALCRHDGERCFLRLCCLGCRTREVTAILPDDYSRRTGVLTIYRSGKAERSRKNRRPHSIPLDDVTRALFEWTLEHREALRPTRGNFKAGWERFVFPWGDGYVDRFAARLRAGLGEDAERYMPTGDIGLDGKRRAGITFYALRHLGATLAAELTGDALKVGSVIGDRGLRTPGTYMAKVRGATEAHAGTLADVARALDAGGVHAAARARPLPQSLPLAVEPVARPLRARVEGEPGWDVLRGGTWEHAPARGEVASVDVDVGDVDPLAGIFPDEWR